VLVIDDEESARYALASRLAAVPFEVVELADPREAVRCARELQPAAIFLDLVMPQMQGVEVLDRLRDATDTARIPVVVVTSKVLTAGEESAVAARGAALLSKEECARPDAVARILAALRDAGFSVPAAGRPAPAQP
jgi:CheY-like chemotaxis protein